LIRLGSAERTGRGFSAGESTDPGGNVLIRNRSMRVITLALCLALALPAAAIAVKPKPGQYVYAGAQSSVTFEVTKKRKVKLFQRFDNCATVPLKIPTMKIRKGKFKFEGTVKDVIGQSFKIEIAGKFVTKTKAKGKVELTRTSGASCVGVHPRYTAKWQKPQQSSGGVASYGGSP
jgi:hypothetical protein